MIILQFFLSDSCFVCVKQTSPWDVYIMHKNTCLIYLITDTKARFLDLYLSISNDLFLPKFIINVTILILKLSISIFLDGDVPRSTSYGAYISKIIRFARASSHVVDFKTRNKLLT